MNSVERKATAILGAILVAQAAIHFFLLDDLFFNDEGHFLAYSWMAANGHVIYRDFFEHHPPLIEFLGAPVIALAGPSVEALRLLSLAAALLTTVCVFAAGRTLYGKKTALACAAGFALCAPLFFGFWFVTEPFLALAVAAGAALFLSWSRSRSAPALAVAGFAAGAALLLKPQAAALIIALPFLLRAYRAKRMDYLVCLCSVAAPFLLASLYFLANGALWQFVYYAYLFTVPNAAAVFLKLMPSGYYDFILIAVAFIAAIPAALSLASRRSTPDAFVLLVFLAASALFAFPRVDAFHFVPFLAPLSLALGGMHPGRWRGYLVGLVVFTALAAWGTIILSLPANGQILHDHATAAYLAAHTEPGERIFVAPFNPHLYAYADREPATYRLTFGPYVLNRAAEEEAVAQLEAVQPKYVYFLNSTFEGETTQDYAPVLYEYIFSHYDPVYFPSAPRTYEIVLVRMPGA